MRLGGTFDAVLLLVTLGGEDADHLIGAAAVTAAEQARNDVNVVADAELVSQDILRYAKSRWTAATAARTPFVMGSMSLQ